MNAINKNYIERHKFLVLALIVISVSCQKVINVDLNTASPKLVIDASISDQPGPYTILLYQSVGFNQDNVFPPVQGALVSIDDNAGNTDSLKEVLPGTYQTSVLQGIPGRTYKLTVNSDGNVYTATSTMPLPVNIDTIFVENSLRSKNKDLLIRFSDPADSSNYYRIVEKVTNSQPVNGKIVLPTLGSVTSDRLANGSEINFTPDGNQPQLVPGDTVLVSLQCIDKNVYDYFRTARQNGSASTTLSNPVTNITAGALGYFSAYSVRTKIIVVK